LERELARILHEAMPAHIQVLTRSLSSLVSRLAKEWHIAASADDNNAVQQLLSSVYKDYQDIQKRDCKTEREAAFLLTGQQHVYRAYNAGSHRGRLEQGASLEQLLSKLITDIEGPYR